MYAAALGFNHIGIPFAYAMGYYLQLSLRLWLSLVDTNMLLATGLTVAAPY
jgi:hypothetical protein